jgi:hypothetical protein
MALRPAQAPPSAPHRKPAPRYAPFFALRASTLYYQGLKARNKKTEIIGDGGIRAAASQIKTKCYL